MSVKNYIINLVLITIYLFLLLPYFSSVAKKATYQEEPINAEGIVLWLLEADTKKRKAIASAILRQADLGLITKLREKVENNAYSSGKRVSSNYTRYYEQQINELKKIFAKPPRGLRTRTDLLLFSERNALESTERALCRNYLNANYVINNAKGWQVKRAVRIKYSAGLDLIILLILQDRTQELVSFAPDILNSVSYQNLLPPKHILRLRHLFYQENRRYESLYHKKIYLRRFSSESVCAEFRNDFVLSIDGNGQKGHVKPINFPLSLRGILHWLDNLDNAILKKLLAAMEPVNRRKVLMSLADFSQRDDLARKWFIKEAYKTGIVKSKQPVAQQGLTLYQQGLSVFRPNTEEITSETLYGFSLSQTRFASLENIFKKRAESDPNTRIDLAMLYYLQKRYRELQITLSYFDQFSKGALYKKISVFHSNLLTSLLAYQKSKFQQVQKPGSKSDLLYLLSTLYVEIAEKQMKNRELIGELTKGLSVEYRAMINTLISLRKILKIIKNDSEILDVGSKMVANDSVVMVSDQTIFQASFLNNLQEYFRKNFTRLTRMRRENSRRALLADQRELEEYLLSIALDKRMQLNKKTGEFALDIILKSKRLSGDELYRLYSKSRDLISRGDQNIANAYTKIMGLRSNLSRNYHSEKEYQSILFHLEKSEASLVKRLNLEDEAYNTKLITSKDLRRVIGEKDVFITFRKLELINIKSHKREGSHMMMVALKGKKGDVRIFNLGKVSQISKLSETLFSENIDQRFNSRKKLSKIIYEPLVDILQGAGTVYISADGPLHMVPFEMLNGFEGKYWIETHDIRRVSSGRDLVKARPLKYTSRGFIGFGGAQYGANLKSRNRGVTKFSSLKNFSELLETGPEVRSVAKIWNGKVDSYSNLILGDKATETALKKITTPPRVLHIATHGFYLPGGGKVVERPLLLSGLATTAINKSISGAKEGSEDGVLWAFEVVGLPLTGTQLVILSACDTAHGVIDASEGVYGLGRAFQVAGAENIVLTLWVVNDASARMFMEDFYNTWLSQDRQDPAIALRAVKLKWLSSVRGSKSDPKVWAPYILVQSGR